MVISPFKGYGVYRIRYILIVEIDLSAILQCDGIHLAAFLAGSASCASRFIHNGIITAIGHVFKNIPRCSNSSGIDFKVF
jgi:hypothetical protein